MWFPSKVTLLQILAQKSRLLQEFDKNWLNRRKWGPHTVPRDLGMETNPGNPIPGDWKCTPCYVQSNNNWCFLITVEASKMVPQFFVHWHFSFGHSSRNNPEKVLGFINFKCDFHQVSNQTQYFMETGNGQKCPMDSIKGASHEIALI